MTNEELDQFFLSLRKDQGLVRPGSYDSGYRAPALKTVEAFGKWQDRSSNPEKLVPIIFDAEDTMEQPNKRQLAVVLGSLLRFCNDNNTHRTEAFQAKYGVEASKAIELMIQHTVYGEMYRSIEQDVLPAFLDSPGPQSPVEKLIKENNGE